jgi:hypothetical protein
MSIVLFALGLGAFAIFQYALDSPFLILRVPTPECSFGFALARAVDRSVVIGKKMAFAHGADRIVCPTIGIAVI